MVKNKRRFPAEWETESAILMALPNASTDWKDTLEDVLRTYKCLIRTFIDAGEKVLLLVRDKDEAEKIIEIAEGVSLRYVEYDFNDTWTRDYGPLTIEIDGEWKALDFGFNGWGLKFAADKDNLASLALVEAGILRKEAYANCRDFILEGGSVESDGHGIVLTTSRCLCSPNRNGGKSKQQIEEALHRLLGAEKILWLDYGALEGDDTDSHIDTLARLCPDNTILFTDCQDKEDPHHEEMDRMHKQLETFTSLQEKQFRLIPLPFPTPQYDKEGQRLPATYANYLATDRNVFFPTYSDPEKDIAAKRAISMAFPGHNIMGIDCRALIVQHGSLHCATMQIPKKLIKSSKL